VRKNSRRVFFQRSEEKSELRRRENGQEKTHLTKLGFD
jgi:hypothetical protein